MESWLMAVDCVGRYAGSWSYIPGSTRNHENEGKTNNLGWMLYSVDAVLGVCCIRCQLMIMSWRDREGWLNLVFCGDGWVVDEKERDGGWRWEWYGGYERIWDIRGMTCLIGLGRPCIGDGSRRIGTLTCHIGDGELTRTRNSLSPSFSWWFPLISHFLVLNSTITYEHEFQSSLSISPCHNQDLTQSTAYTKYSIIPRSTVSRSQPVSHPITS